MRKTLLPQQTHHKCGRVDGLFFFFDIFSSVRAADPIAPPTHRHLGNAAAAAAQGRCLIPYCLPSSVVPQGMFSDPLSHTQGRLPHSKRGAQTGQSSRIPGISVCQQLSGNLLLGPESTRIPSSFFDVIFPLRSISPFPSERLRERIAILWQG